MRKTRYPFWPILAIYTAFAFAWLLTGDWLLADKTRQQMSLPWDVATDIAFALCSLGLLAWMLARYRATHRELSTSYDGLFQSANDAFLIFDETGAIVDANRKACALYGYPLERLQGLTGRAIVHPDYYQRFEGFSRASQEDLEQTIGSVDVRSDGSSIPVEVRGAIISYHGKPHRLAIVRDISARRAMEQSQVVTDQRLQEQLTLLSLTAELGVALTKGRDMEEMLQRCAELLAHHLDAAFARIWTLDPGAEMLHLVASAGMYTHLNGPHGRIPVNDQTKIGSIALHKKPHLTNAVLGDPQISDQEWARQQGMVAFAGQPLLIGNRVVGVMGLFARHPLSEVVLQALGAMADEVALGLDRMWAEAELVQKNRALRTLSACNEILVRAAQEEKQFLSDTCQAIVQHGGYKMAWVGLKENNPDCGIRIAASAGDAEGYLAGINISWGDNQWGQGPTGKAIRTGAVTYCDDVEHCDGFTPWREAARVHRVGSSVAIPLKQDQETIGALNIYAAEPHGFGTAEVTLLQELAVDVAYGIQVLRERAEARKGVEEKARLEKQVRQGQKMEAIGTLAGGIAHDFNNILAAILGFTDLAKYKLPKDSELVHDLDNVLQAGLRAKELVKQILAFSRQAEQERRPIEVYLVLKEALKLLRASIPTTIDFQLSIDEKSGAVLADPTQIHQIIMNLCTNAYHAMRTDESGVLGVALRALEIGGGETALLRPGKYLELAVSDTGCGMTPAIMERIFDPYFTTKPRGEGTGLGLAMVHGIVTQYGGEIRVESTLNRGTTLRVYLPQAERGAPEIDRIIAQQMPGGNERVLVVDDEAMVLAMHKNMLERLGYRVTARPNSTDALAEFASRPQEFDLVLTDMAMPGMPGDVLAHKIRQLRPDIPILMCTGFSELLTPERAEAVGIGKIIMKPLLFRELATSIREFIDS